MPSERIGIELEVMGYAQAKKQMEDISRLTSTFRGKDAKIEINGNWDTVRNHIKNLRQELRSLQSESERLAKLGGRDLGQNFIGPMQKVDQELTNVNAKMKTVQNTINRLSTASQNAGKSLRATFNAVSSQVAHLGSAMQSVGNALTRFAMPFQSLMQGTVFGMGYSLLGKVSSGLSSGFERYDTLTKYPRMMESLGYEAEATEASLNKLDKSVRGLPTGLNEIVETAQRFTLSLGDINKGTDLAIAANNAFLASMSTESQQYQGMLQLQDLMNGKDLTSREWMSLGTSMGTAINEIGKYLGYGADQMGDFRAELYAGNIATQDFLDALVAVGTNGGKIEQLAQLSKSTWDAVSRNLGNAFARMTAGVLESLDEISEQLTGKTLVGYLAQDVLPIIDKVTASIKEWIKAHPREISDFFRDLKRLDIKGLLKGYAEGFGSILKMFQGFARFMGGRNLEWLGKFMGMSGFLGRGLTISGGLVKGSRHIVAGLVTGLRALAETFPILEKLKKFPFLGKIFGKGGTGDVVAKTATGGGGFLTGLFNMLKGSLSIAGSIAALGGAGFVAFKSVKSMLKDLDEIIDIASDIDWDKGVIVLGGMTAFFGAFTTLGFAVGKWGEASGTIGGLTTLKGTAMIGAITTVISAFADLDSYLIKQAMLNIKATVEALGETLTLVHDLPLAGSLSALKRSVESALEIYETMKFNGDRNGLWSISEREAKGLYKRITYMNDAIKALAESIEYVSKIDDIPNLDSAKENLVNLATALGEIYNAVEDQFILVTKKEAKKESNVLGSVGEMIDSIDHIYDTLRVRQWNKPMHNRVEGIKTMFDELKKLYDNLDTMFTGEEKNSASISSAMGSFTEVIGYIDTIYDTLRNREWDKKMYYRVEHIKTMFTYLEELYKQLDTSFNEEGNSGEIASTMNNFQAIIASIDQIYDTLRVREWDKNIESRVGNIKDMLNALVTLEPSLVNLSMYKTASASTTIDGITAVVKSLATLGSESGTLDGVNLDSMVSKLHELIPQVQEVAKGITDGFIQNVDYDAMSKSVKDGLDKVLKAMDGYKDDFSAKARTLANSFKQTLQSELQNISVSATITVRLTSAIVEGVGIVHSAVRDSLNSLRQQGVIPDNAYYQALGGYIYRAKGGGIGKRRGTDIVPAMLTPGEFVQNKHAVALFGREFMERVNALDINGAMNAMQARLGSRIVSNRTSTVNNVVNNNQRMTQNVYTNNPQFAKIRRTRYTGAL